MAVAVSVLIVFGWRAKEAPPVRRGPARAEKREVAGRASREAERRNTILIDECEVWIPRRGPGVLYVDEEDSNVILTPPRSVFGRKNGVWGSLPLAVLGDVGVEVGVVCCSKRLGVHK